jgi:hypothetical protein
MGSKRAASVALESFVRELFALTDNLALGYYGRHGKGKPSGKGIGKA